MFITKNDGRYDREPFHFGDYIRLQPTQEKSPGVTEDIAKWLNDAMDNLKARKEADGEVKNVDSISLDDFSVAEDGLRELHYSQVTNKFYHTKEAAEEATCLERFRQYVVDKYKIDIDPVVLMDIMMDEVAYSKLP